MLKVKNLTHLSQKRREFWLLGVIALSKNKYYRIITENEMSL